MVKPYPLDSNADKFDPPRETATVVSSEANVLAQKTLMYLKLLH